MTDKASKLKDFFCSKDYCHHCNANDWFCSDDCILIFKCKQLTDEQWEDIAKKYDLDEDRQKVINSIWRRR